MDDRDWVLARVPEDAGGSPPDAGGPRVRTIPESGLWEIFLERLQAHSGEVKALQDLSRLAGRAVCDSDVPADVKAMMGEPAPSVWDAEIGVTMAEFAVAETGSLVLAAKAGRRRLASLAPPVHAVLIRKSQVVSSLDEAIERLPAQTSVIITGPSRTADVEGVMVMGVHGPKRLWVVPLAESEPD
ncbi:MAG: LUD domain-containing protein [Armatimonadetes bacterium]|nr:LUD domain-containing protein [Armatimonadota bacterium]